MDSKVFSREEFRLLREAKRLIKDEFGEVISLTSHNLKQEICDFAKKSGHGAILNIFEKVYQDHPEANSTNPESGIHAKRYYRGGMLE